MKKCPYCAEEIQDEAIFCRYCHRDLTNNVDNIADKHRIIEENIKQPQLNKSNSPSTLKVALIIIAIMIIGLLIIHLFFPSLQQQDPIETIGIGLVLLVLGLIAGFLEYRGIVRFVGRGSCLPLFTIPGFFIMLYGIILLIFRIGGGFILAPTATKVVQLLPQPSATRVVQQLLLPSATRVLPSSTPKPTEIAPTPTKMTCLNGCDRPSPGCTIAALDVDTGCVKGTYLKIEEGSELLEMASKITEFKWFCSESDANNHEYYKFGDAKCGDPKKFELYGMGAPPEWNESESKACPNGCKGLVNNTCLIPARTDPKYGKIYFTYASSLNAFIKQKNYLT